ncbi:hypothetical protein K488DRAFT_51103, partial [Vararia minispora EC-137]
DSYPHAFRDDEGLQLFCSPIFGSGTYNDSLPGADREVFNTAGTYYAVITHTGASETNGFVLQQRLVIDR